MSESLEQQKQKHNGFNMETDDGLPALINEAIVREGTEYVSVATSPEHPGLVNITCGFCVNGELFGSEGEKSTCLSLEGARLLMNRIREAIQAAEYDLAVVSDEQSEAQ